MIYSPISITEFMSCVTTIVVVLSFWVNSSIRSSILIAVRGSSPEFGSSQNKYFESLTIALAIPTLFFHSTT